MDMPEAPSATVELNAAGKQIKSRCKNSEILTRYLVSVGKPFEPGIISLRQRSVPNPHLQETKKARGPSSSVSFLQQIIWQNWFFRACAFIIRIPFVFADTGDDFSNNLATDLAPILSLFGEQVTKQV